MAAMWILLTCLLKYCVAFETSSFRFGQLTFISTQALKASMAPEARRNLVPLFAASVPSPRVGATSLLQDHFADISFRRPVAGAFGLSLPLVGRTVALKASLDRNHNFDISPNKVDQLFDKIEELGIDVQQDIEEKFVRGSGAGGQKINKTNSMVQMRHMPTGLQVSCQRERAREKNRFLALRQLVEKIEAAKGGGATKADKALEKKRKQKGRRKRRTSSAPKAASDSTDGETTEDSEELSGDDEGPLDDDSGASQTGAARSE